MSFLWCRRGRRSKVSFEHGSHILPAHTGVCETPDPWAGEKTSGASCHPASLTVEAAVMMPLFLLTMFLCWNLFLSCTVHIRIQHALDEVSAQIAEQSYLIETLGSGSGKDTSDGGLTFSKIAAGAAWRTTAHALVVQAVGQEALDSSPIQGGAWGLTLLRSSWNRHKDVKLVCDYQLAFRIPLGNLFRINVKQVSLRKCWTGKQPAASGQKEESEESTEAVEYVYVTETGTVYHRSINCYHLNVTVRKVPASAVGGKRNRGGGKYTACQHCAVGVDLPATLYITPEGDRYHVTRDCSGLKRTVKTVPLSQVSFRPCKHCGGEQK